MSSAMPYQIVHCEVTDSISPVTLTARFNGIWLVVRRNNRLVGQLQRRLNTPCSLSDTHLKAWIAEALGEKILQECLLDDLQSKAEQVERMPALTVAICTKDRAENVARLLASLDQLQGAKSAPAFRILIVDNAPTDNRTKTVVGRYPLVDYAREPRAGLNFARNCALREATTEWLAYLDDDVTVDPHWHQGWQEAWVENPDAGAITGLVLPYELETEAQILFERRGGFGRGFEKIRFCRLLLGNTLYPCGAGIFGAGCNMSFRRQALLDLGGFDEALDTGRPLPGGGDLDIFYRVIRAGYPLIYEPQYAVYHQHRRTMSQLRHQYWTWGLGLMAFVSKSMQSDPAMRFRFMRLIRWWLHNQLWQFPKAIFSFHLLPPSMVWAELYGGILGLFGEYGRSQRRVEAIRRGFNS
jgi:glycosyltransferase involved in cell wall biosynthesis